MVDPQWLQARLDSPLFAALAQTVELAIPVVQADAGAGRVYEAPAPAPPAYVSTGRLGIERSEEPAVHDWPADTLSVFERLQQQGAMDKPFRPTQLLNPSHDGRALFGPVEARGPIRDCLAVALPLDQPAWCLLMLFRCNGQAGFTSEEQTRLAQWQPVLTRTVARGYCHELGREDPPSHAVAPTAPSTAATGLIARLSKTERQVLNHLREQQTEREIADRMHRSPHTVHVHVKNIYRKLAVSSRKELLNLFEPTE